jgi:CheY-like chemotaxis protein
VLFVDNTDSVQIARSEIMESAGYHVVCFATAAQAKQAIAATYVQAAIFDKRLTDDDDDRDISGIELRCAQEFRHLPAMILTVAPDDRRILQLLASRGQGSYAFTDLVGKDDTISTFLERLRHLFEQHVHVNFDLHPIWHSESAISLSQYVWVDVDPHKLVELSQEFEDLLGHIFFKFDTLTIRTPIWRRDGRVALPVSVAQKSSAPQEFILVCGGAQAIQAEEDNFCRDTRQRTRAGSQLVHSARTLHFGALAYELVGADSLIALQPMKGYFTVGNPEQTLQKAVKNGLRARLKDLGKPLRGNLHRWDWWMQHFQLGAPLLTTAFLGERIHWVLDHAFIGIGGTGNASTRIVW